MPDRHTGNRKIFDRAQRVNTPIGVSRNLSLAKQVMFAPCRDAVEVNRARRGERERSRHFAVRRQRRVERLEIVFCHEDGPGSRAPDCEARSILTTAALYMVPQASKWICLEGRV
jgi:hypothetical protein